MDLVEYMSDVLGPRLAGSPNLRRAQQWAKTKMEAMGLTNVVIEPFGEHGVGWQNRYTSLHLLEPDYQPLIGYAEAFTPGTNGKVTAAATIVDVRQPADLERYRGKLKGVIALTSPPMPVGPRFAADATRLSDDTLTAWARATIGTRYGIDQTEYAWDSDIRSYLPVGQSSGGGGGVSPITLLRFLRDEGVAAVFEAAPGGDGTVFVTGRPGNRQDRSYRGVMSAPPMVAVAAEHYNRIYRILKRGLPVKLEVEVQNTIDTTDTKEYNVLGELRGTDLADQIVMAGGHYDSWHAATGATDNAAGCAVVLEAVRILQAIGAKPRRTIRVALWSYEEGGVNGSRQYVANHFGSGTRRTPQAEKFSVYFNSDNGGGQFRGVYLQGNERARPVFEAWMRPFQDLGLRTLTINNTFGTDVVGFDEIDLPAFQFIQDPLDYETRSHHSNMDVYDKLIPDDLRRNAVIMAGFLYLAATRDELFPRESH
jgi:hypothetical protein